MVNSFQSREAYECLRREGVLVGDSSYDDFADELTISEAYRWLRRRMTDRLGVEVEGMVWAWVAARRRDLGTFARLGRGGVLITARVPRARLVLSQYDAWHDVLNRSLHLAPLRDEGLESWERRFDVAWNDWADRVEPYRGMPIEAWPTDLRRELEGSWDDVIEPIRTTDQNMLVQATISELRAHDVVRAVRIR